MATLDEYTETGGYVPPLLTVHGGLTRETGAQAVGMVTDRAFPQGTPIQDLTFSGV